MKLSATASKALEYMARGYTLTVYGADPTHGQGVVEHEPGQVVGYEFGVQPAVLRSLLAGGYIRADRQAEYTFTYMDGYPLRPITTQVHAQHYTLTDSGG